MPAMMTGSAATKVKPNTRITQRRTARTSARYARPGASGASADLREVSVRGEVLHDSAGGQDLMRERRERTDRRVATGRPKRAVSEVERDLVAVLRQGQRVG